MRSRYRGVTSMRGAISRRRVAWRGPISLRNGTGAVGRRVVAFRDETTGKVTAWKWDFGDGSRSTEQNPIHQYAKGGDYTVTLGVEGPEGKSSREKIWDVAVK